MKDKIEIQEIDYHRNGICGEGFHAIIFRWKDGQKWRRMLAHVFSEPGQCAIHELSDLKDATVKFGVNSWRGDHFEPAMRRAIEKRGLEVDIQLGLKKG